MCENAKELDEESKKVADLLVSGASIAGKEASVNAARFLCNEAAAEYVNQKLSLNAQ